MKYRKLSPTGDYMFGYGNTSFVSDIEAVRQAIYTKLKLFQNEWWEDLNDGLPFFEQIAGTYDKNNIDTLIRNRILETPNVTSVKSLDSKISEDRKYSATVEVNTAYGATTVEVNL